MGESVFCSSVPLKLSSKGLDSRKLSDVVDYDTGDAGSSPYVAKVLFGNSIRKIVDNISMCINI